MRSLSLTIFRGTFAIHQMAANAPVPEYVFKSHFYAIFRTHEELSLLLPDHIKLKSERVERGWSCIKVDGELDFNLVGILANLAAVFAGAQIPIFALSSFSTDYILIKQENVTLAKAALVSAGYQISQAEGD
jgi:uncharacterized protein